MSYADGLERIFLFLYIDTMTEKRKPLKMCALRETTEAADFRVFVAMGM